MHEINIERLQDNIETLSQIGRSEDHGIYRMAFTDDEIRARTWLKNQITEAGLDLYEDEAGNIHGRYHWDPDKPSIVTGSHIDTVPGAGHLDGALGVLSGLECLRRVCELNLETSRPLELVAFSDEEGRFGGMFGSQAVSGILTPAQLYSAQDHSGQTLVSALESYGLDPDKVLRAKKQRGSIRSFIELHIEQGPVLDQRQTKIGVVEGIVGLFRWQVRLIGSANHAGTTPMDMRQDAFQGLAEFASEIDRILEENGSDRSVATIGQVQLEPNAANVVPGKVEFTLEVRDTDEDILSDLANAFRRALSSIARRRDLMFEFEVTSELQPAKCDPLLQQIITNIAEKLDYSALSLPSGAAHDTQMIANIAPVGMIFVPSKQGRSHSPAEWTDWEDIEAGANVLLNTLYQLATD